MDAQLPVSAMRGPLQVKGRLNAEDLVEALREAHRVAKPGPRLAMTAFG
jgi:hypothetical protein